MNLGQYVAQLQSLMDNNPGLEYTPVFYAELHDGDREIMRPLDFPPYVTRIDQAGNVIEGRELDFVDPALINTVVVVS